MLTKLNYHISIDFYTYEYKKNIFNYVLTSVSRTATVVVYLHEVWPRGEGGGAKCVCGGGVPLLGVTYAGRNVMNFFFPFFLSFFFPPPLSFRFLGRCWGSLPPAPPPPPII